MALLTRVRQKIFGGSGATGEFGKIGSKAAGSPVTTKDLALIQELSQYDSGYFSIVSDQGTSKLPYSEDLNSLFFLMTSQLAYLFQSGVPEWLNDIDQRYYAGVSLVNRNGRIYIAILGDDGANVNAQRDPETEPTWWKQIAGPPKETTIAVTGAFTPGSQNERLIIDTTLGAVTVTIADGTFDGQRLNVHCIDAGTANGFYKGTGIYDGAGATGTYISPGFDIWLEWSETEGRWTYEDVVTTDYASGGNTIFQTTKGRAKVYVQDNIAIGTGAITRNSTIALPLTGSIAAGGPSNESIDGAQITQRINPYLTSTTNLKFVISSNLAQNITFTAIVEGDY